MVRSSLLFLLFILGLVNLTGCQHQPAQPRPASSSQHWEAEGKIAITTATDRTNASFNWQQRQQNYRLSFFGPFGLGAAILVKEGKTVWFESQEHGKHSANSAEQLMRKHLGWQLPVTELAYWLQGQPSPNAAITASQRNPQGQLMTLQQQGWDMSFSQYQAFGPLWLPGKLIASQGGIKVIIVTKNWVTPPQP